MAHSPVYYLNLSSCYASFLAVSVACLRRLVIDSVRKALQMRQTRRWERGNKSSKKWVKRKRRAKSNRWKKRENRKRVKD